MSSAGGMDARGSAGDSMRFHVARPRLTSTDGAPRRTRPHRRRDDPGLRRRPASRKPGDRPPPSSGATRLGHRRRRRDHRHLRRHPAPGPLQGRHDHERSGAPATARHGLTRVADLPSSRLSVVRATEPRPPSPPCARIPTSCASAWTIATSSMPTPAARPTGRSSGASTTRASCSTRALPGTEGLPDVDVDVLQAHAITTGDPSVVVAVIDDGVDFSHPDLAGRAWTNPGESGGGKETNGVDDDGNGFIDDVHGWDFCHDDNTVHDFDDDFHGTHVAGTIAASLDGAGVVGVAPSVKIMALKFINSPADGDCGWDEQAIAAIDYAASFGVHIANTSWGRRGDPGERVRAARRDGCGPDAVRGVGRQPGHRQRRGLPRPAGHVRPAEHRLDRRDRQLRWHPGLLQLRRDDRRHRGPGRRHPEHAPGRQLAPATGLGLARRHVDGGAARDRRRSP